MAKKSVSNEDIVFFFSKLKERIDSEELIDYYVMSLEKFDYNIFNNELSNTNSPMYNELKKYLDKVKLNYFASICKKKSSNGKEKELRIIIEKIFNSNDDLFLNTKIAFICNLINKNVEDTNELLELTEGKMSYDEYKEKLDDKYELLVKSLSSTFLKKELLDYQKKFVSLFNIPNEAFKEILDKSSDINEKSIETKKSSINKTNTKSQEKENSKLNTKIRKLEKELEEYKNKTKEKDKKIKEYEKINNELKAEKEKFDTKYKTENAELHENNTQLTDKNNELEESVTEYKDRLDFLESINELRYLIKYHEIKKYYESKKDTMTLDFKLRIYRALTWTKASIYEEKSDEKLIKLWISFNALYGSGFADKKGVDMLLKSINKVDKNHLLDNVIKDNSTIIEEFIKIPEVYKEYWEDEKLKKKEREEKVKNQILEMRNKFDNFKTTGLHANEFRLDLFGLIYLLRNQVFHGSASYDSGENRYIIKNCVEILEAFNPVIIKVMIDNPNNNWHKVKYRPVPYDEFVPKTKDEEYFKIEVENWLSKLGESSEFETRFLSKNERRILHRIIDSNDDYICKENQNDGESKTFIIKKRK